MRKILKKMKDEKGSITSVVLVTVLFFIIILSTALMISGTQRKSQLDSEITLKQVYQNQVDDAEKISKSLVVVKAPIPDGYYYVGGTDETGVVISDNIADKDRYKGEEDVGKDLEGNQWVWVPVETPSSLYTTVSDGVALDGSTGVKTTKYTNSEIISGQTRVLPGDTSSSREPDILTGSSYDYSNYATAGYSSLANMAETMVSDYEEMIASLEKYKGFYIGRYELTANGEKTGATQTDVDWYTLYKNCTTLAVGTKVKTRMIWGLQWDATCNWLASSGFNIKDSSTWGNYRGNTADGHGTKQNTGYSESWKANNIYDFAGNCWELTQEAYTNVRARRGGFYDNFGSIYPASSRSDTNPIVTFSRVSSRPTLYLIPWDIEAKSSEEELKTSMTKRKQKEGYANA
mgnify:CR=1 FL=1